MSVVERPHCREPEACAAKGAGHCRRCAGLIAGKAAMARLRSDPVMVERMVEAARRNGSNPEVTIKRVAAMKKNRVWRQRVARAATKWCRHINSDPILSAKRAEAVAASVAGRVQRNAQRLAAKAGIPVHLVPEFRYLRWSKHYGQSDAVAFLMREHPADFVPIFAAQREAARRAAGPAPAIGMPGRIAWTQKVNGHSSTGASA